MPDEVATIEALRRLQAHEPATDDQYIARDGSGLSIAWGWPKRLELELRAGGRPRILMHGPIGVGKTTELLRWGRMLAAWRPLVVRVDAPKDPWDAAWQIFHDVLRQLELGQQLLQTIQLPRTYNAGEPVSDPAALAAAWTSLIGHPSRPSAAGHRAPGLLLIDGIDLIPPSQVTTFFGPGSPLALPALPPCVIVAPNTLITLSPATERDPRFDVVHVWPFPVRDPHDKRVEPTCEWLAHGLLHRLADLPLRFEPGIPELIVEMSGGVPRDAIRMLRQALITSVGQPSVGTAAAFAGMREVRQDLEQALTDEERRGLEALAAWLSLEAPGTMVTGLDSLASAIMGLHGEQTAPPVPAVDRQALIRKSAVLVYEGEESRYALVHPLLRARARRPSEFAP